MGSSSHKLRQTSRALQMESLEPRLALALTVTLARTGELNIKGSNSADQIVIARSGQAITINGVRGTFAESAVQSIVVNTLGGNDKIIFQGFAANYSKPIKVINSGGIDQLTSVDRAIIRLNAGATFARGSTNTSSTTTSSTSTTTASAAAPAPDWFDANITDAALRSLLKTGFGDRVIDRKEMLALFTQVAKDRVVSTNEFNDLTKVANNASLFNSVEYVGVLTKKVVVGDLANATFQGTTLGNLKANANAVQLEKLVGKWFLGTDRPATTTQGVTFAYAQASGTLFGASGPLYSHVEQGYVGDCYFVGALAEIALKSPSAIKDMFIVNGDGTYTVRFFNNGKADFVTVDGQLPVTSQGRFVFANVGNLASSSFNVLWVALAEKAYAQMNQSGWLRTGLPGNGSNAYAAIEGGYFSHATKQIANRVSSTTWVGTGSFDQVKQAFDAGKFIGFASNSAPQLSTLVGGHQYVVQSYNATLKTVTLFNPWGLNNGTSAPGLVTLTWSQIAANFSYWDRA